MIYDAVLPAFESSNESKKNRAEKEKYTYAEKENNEKKIDFLKMPKENKTEDLPLPGESDGVFAYVDGSSNLYNKSPKDFQKRYGAGYVISTISNNGEREIRFGHTTKDVPEDMPGRRTVFGSGYFVLRDLTLTQKLYQRKYRPACLFQSRPAGVFQSCDNGLLIPRECNADIGVFAG